MKTHRDSNIRGLKRRGKLLSRYDGVIFSGNDSSKQPGNMYCYRGIGPYRLRTVAEKSGYKIKIIDFSDNLSKSELLQLIDRYVDQNCLFLGVSTTFLGRNSFETIMASEILGRAKSISPKIQIVSGGAYSLLFAHGSVDWYVKGYADVAFPALLDYFTGKSHSIKSAMLSLPEKPWIKGKVVDGDKDYPLLDCSDLMTKWLPEDGIKSYEALPIEIARGCIFRCAFCSYPVNGKKKFDYIRSKENLLTELRRNYELYGVQHYGFMDDTYNDSEFKMNQMQATFKELDFKVKFSSFIKPELLVTWPHHVDLLLESGLEGSCHGIESFHPKTRQTIRKGKDLESMFAAIEKLAKGGVGTQGSFIVGLPHEPIESCQKTHDWLKANTHILNTVSWFGLEIKVPTASGYVSEIDREPAKYGYRLHVQSERSILWENDHMNAKIADQLAQKFDNDFQQIGKIGGWHPAMLRSMKIVDVDTAKKNGALRSSIKSKDLFASRQEFTDEYLRLQLEVSRPTSEAPIDHPYTPSTEVR